MIFPHPSESSFLVSSIYHLWTLALSCLGGCPWGCGECGPAGGGPGEGPWAMGMFSPHPDDEAIMAAGALLDLPQRPRPQQPPLWNTNLDVNELPGVLAETPSRHASQVAGYLPLCVVVGFLPCFERRMEKTVESLHAENP